MVVEVQHDPVRINHIRTGDGLYVEPGQYIGCEQLLARLILDLSLEGREELHTPGLAARHMHLRFKELRGLGIHQNAGGFR